MKAIINTSVCTMLAQPTWESTVMDEALYGMVVDILSEPAEGWYKIRTHYQYEGIVSADDLIVGDDAAAAWEKRSKKIILNKNFCDVLSEPKVQGWTLANLARGCVVAPVEEARDGWMKVQLADGRMGYVPEGILGEYYTAPLSEDEDTLRKALVDRALRYQGTHYRWGGKSPAGIDCSGLVSMAYMLCGILIYRDAEIREEFPLREIPLDQIKPGDAIFFPGHVGMYIGDGRYVHTTARAGDNGVTINSLNPEDPDFRADLKEKITHIGSYFA